MRKRRIFIGINIPTKTKKILKDLQSKIAKKPIRLVNLENLHITLNFLGPRKDREVIEVRHALERIVPSFPSFPVWLDNLRFFPSQSRANVISVIIKSDGKLEKLQKAIQKELSQFEFIKLEKREFKPHITIARIRNKGIKTIDLERIKNIKIERGEWQIKNVELIQSVLRRGGSKYTILKEYELQNV